MSRKILVDPNNSDVYDTLNEPLLESLPKDLVPDNLENRANAALAVAYQLAQQLNKLRDRVDIMSAQISSQQSSQVQYRLKI